MKSEKDKHLLVTQKKTIETVSHEMIFVCVFFYCINTYLKLLPARIADLKLQRFKF